MFKLKISLYGKLLILAAVLELILIFILIFGAFGFNVLNDRDKVRYAETITLESYHLRTEFSKKKELRLTDKFHQNMIKFYSILKPYKNDPKVKTLIDNVEEYHQNFEKYIQLMRKRGLNENRGVEGRFRTAVHNMEDIIKETGQYKIYVDMLQARRREKDFIMRRKDEYVKKVETAVNNIKSHTEELEIESKNKTQIFNLSDHYLNSFKELVEVFRELKALEKELEANEKSIQVTLESIVNEKAQIAELNQEIQVYVAIFSLIIGILLSVLIARNITKPVVALERATSRISEGDLDTQVDIKTGDEIEELAKTFNEMVTNLKRSNETILQQQDKLKSQNEKLESLAIDLQNSFENLSLLNQIGKSITSALSFDEVFTELYHHVSVMIDSPIFAIGIFDENKNKIDYKLVIKNSQRKTNFSVSMEETNRLDVLCITTGQNIHVGDFNNERTQLQSEYGSYVKNGKPLVSQTVNINSCYYLPIKVEQKTIGILIIESRNMNAYKKYHIDILNNLASYVAIAMINAQSYEEIKIAHDELKKTQNQLIQAEKMASLGQLTTGIAHEIKNPLNFINNYSDGTVEFCDEIHEDFDEMAKGKLNDKDYRYLHNSIKELEEYLQTINKNGKRIDRIVKSMMEHARGDSASKSKTDINNFLNEYVKLAYNGFRGQYKSFKAALKYELDDNIPKIDIIQQDFSRVITNIIENGCYSTLKKSELNENGYQPEIKVQTKYTGKYIKIILRDNGLGIKDEILTKIFNPFFTTKPTGEGTGLGLSLSYDIIKSGHNGEMKVNSQLNEYAEFVIELPVNRKI